MVGISDQPPKGWGRNPIMGCLPPINCLFLCFFGLRVLDPIVADDFSGFWPKTLWASLALTGQYCGAFSSGKRIDFRDP